MTISASRLENYLKQQINSLKYFEELNTNQLEVCSCRDLIHIGLDKDFFSIKPCYGNCDQLPHEIAGYVKYTKEGMSFLDRIEGKE